MFLEIWHGLWQLSLIVLFVIFFHPSFSFLTILQKCLICKSFFILWSYIKNLDEINAIFGRFQIWCDQGIYFIHKHMCTIYKPMNNINLLHESKIKIERKPSGTIKRRKHSCGMKHTYWSLESYMEIKENTTAGLIVYCSELILLCT